VEPIVVPAPPRSAYNRNRRISDLLLSQLKHFQHVEKKSGDFGIDPEIARNIHTEGGAAKYIAAITTTLRARGLAGTATQPALSFVPTRKSSKKQPNAAPLAIAAAAAPNKSPAKKSEAKKLAKGKK
jgi:hypothetical protein